MPARFTSLLVGLALGLSACTRPPPAPAPAGPRMEIDYEAARAMMVDDIVRQHRAQRRRPGMPREISAAVLAALRATPRHEFVPEEQRPFAYADTPLPIGAGQTISQPYIVALMTELAGVRAGANVLEVGTGSGYQAAVLDHLGARVHTIEIIPELARAAAATLARLGHTRIETRIGDGYAGWPEAAPFDAIIVTAAPDETPAPLIAQLAPGGRLVIPVGPEYGVQDLLLITKDAAGAVTTTRVTGVRFVPLTREKD